jgi:GNAT superfamily N-acetyltransferase
MYQATHSDIPQIVPLFRALHAFHAERLPLRYHLGGSDADYARFLQARLAKGGWIFCSDGAWGPVAYLLALPEADAGDFLHHPARRVKLDHLYVAPPARALGIGQQLVAAMEHKMRAEGFDHWVVGYNAFNTEAEAFYAGQGAVPRGSFRTKWLDPSA